MNIEYLIQLLENKLIVLTNTKSQAFMIGDLSAINSVEAEMAGVTDTLYKLRLLLNASKEAALSNNSLVEAMQIPNNIVTNGSTDCLNDYDITPYATDPLHEQKIADILSSMGPMISPDVIDAYIDSEAIASPVTGQMILKAAQTYAVDVRLMMAIMELDSRFGTAGVAVSTLNPGNVGNDGTNTQTYASWDDGVAAVAAWLSNHRKTIPAPVVEPVIEPIVIPPAPTPVSSTSTPSTSTTTPSTTSTTTPPQVTPPAATSTPTTTATTTPSNTSDTSTTTPESTIQASSTPPQTDTSTTTVSN